MRVRTATPLIVAALSVVLTGCGANFQAQTYQERAQADGENAAVGPIAVRNVNVLPPIDGGEVHEAGADALVGFVLVNDGPEDDRLLEISTDAAESVQLVRGDDLQPVDEVPVPRLGSTGAQYGALLQGLSEELRTGQYVELELRFEDAGTVTVQAPASLTNINDQDQRERSEHFHPIGEEGHGEEHGGDETGGETTGGQGGGDVAEAGEESQESGEHGDPQEESGE